MLLKFLKTFAVKIVAVAAGLQTLSWLFGQDQALAQFLGDHWQMTVVALVGFGFWDYVIFDAPHALYKARFENKIRRAKDKCSRRKPR